MRLAAAVLAASLLAAAPAPADAKPSRFAAKAAKRAKRPSKGWVARVVRVAPSPAPIVHREEPVPEQPVTEGEPVSPAPAPPAAPACDPSPWLGVIAEDVGGFRLRLTRTCVPAGTVLLNFRNNDLSFHNVWAEGVAPVAAKRRVIDDTEGETVVTGSAQLSAGTWRLYCSLPGHEAMSRLVDVTPAG